MKKIVLPKLGMRIVKTALAILISMLITDLLFARTLGWNYFVSVFSVISAVLTIQSSIRESLSFALERVLGTFISVIFGMLFLTFDLLLSKNLWFFYSFVALGSVLVIYVCKAVKKVSASSLCVVVFIAVLFSRDSAMPYVDAAIRVAETLIGVAVAILVNITICPPRVKKDKCLPGKVIEACDCKNEGGPQAVDQDVIEDITSNYGKNDECENKKEPEWYI